MSTVLIGAFYGIGALLFLHSLFILLSFSLSMKSNRADTFSAALGTLLTEWWFALGVLLLWPLGWLPLQRTPKGAAGPSIVLVHGYLNNRASMFGIYWRLRRAGFINVSTLNIGLIRAYGSIEKAGGYMAKKLEAIRRTDPAKHMVCIAHSMGGLVVRSAAMQHTALRSMHIITLGTPHAGTQLAKFGWDKASKDMKPGSTFLTRLNGDQSTTAVQLTRIESDVDNIVFPHAAGAEIGVHQGVSGIGHQQLLFDRKVFELVQRALYLT